MLQSYGDGLGAVLCSPCLILLLLLVLLGADAMQVLLHGCTFAVTYDMMMLLMQRPSWEASG